MIRINLVGEARKPSAAGPALPTSLGSRQDVAIWCMIGVALLSAAGFGVYWWMHRSHIRAQQADIRSAEETVRQLQEIIDEVEEFKAKRAELEHKIEVITQLRNNQRGPVRIMDLVSRSLPELLWLDRMSLNANTVTLNGRSFSANAVANFVESLDQVEAFQEPFLRNTTWNGQVYSFQVVFNYSPEPLNSPIGGTSDDADADDSPVAGAA